MRPLSFPRCFELETDVGLRRHFLWRIVGGLCDACDDAHLVQPVCAEDQGLNERDLFGSRRRRRSWCSLGWRRRSVDDSLELDARFFFIPRCALSIPLLPHLSKEIETSKRKRALGEVPARSTSRRQRCCSSSPTRLDSIMAAARQLSTRNAGVRRLLQEATELSDDTCPDYTAAPLEVRPPRRLSFGFD